MRYLVISVFGPEESRPDMGEIMDAERVGIQIASVRPDRETEYYDWSLSSPTPEYLLDEVTQLASDLIYDSVAMIGGLQPALF